MNFKFLDQPMKLTGDYIEDRYFMDNEDGTYSATGMFKYMVGRDAQKYFRRVIEKLDDQHLYNKLSAKNPEKEVLDSWANEQEREKYKEQFEKLNKKYAEYRDAHPDEFQEVVMIDTGGEDEARFVAAFNPDMNLSLQEAIAGYVAASELVKKYGKDTDNYDNLPRTKPFLKVRPEFQAQHKAMKESWYKEFGLPDPSHFEQRMTKPNYSFRGADINKKFAGQGDEELVENFTKDYVTYLTSSNKIEFKAKAEEMKSLIKENVDILFNETSTFKADTDEHGKISVYTVPTESTPDRGPSESFDPSMATKILTIEPDSSEPGSYSYTFDIITDDETLHYVKRIITKADLRKAIENSMLMVENVHPFKKYYDALADIAENL